MKSDGITTAAKQVGYAPLEIIGTGNNGSVKENNWKGDNEVGINDEKFGDYTDNSLTDVDSNTCTGTPCNEKGYNYGLSNLKWDVEKRTVTGQAGKNVRSVVLKAGENKLIEVEVSKQQFT
ncbi:hypothetical protein, partial [Bacillus cereus]|uniref:hypothetical protein n=1 Tax=Bacillus cereus TaxID=1396 RepID=UPI00115561BC